MNRASRTPGRPTPACAVRLIPLALAWLVALPSSTRADGAFADSQTILLPKARPQRIVASSDVSGLLVSDDDGANWSWICENAIGFFAALFQVGPAPAENLYAVTQTGLAVSTDSGCSWQNPGGVARYTGDVFPDPNDPQRVLVVSQAAVTPDSSVLSDLIVASSDGGRSFDSTQYMTSVASITGVEIARSDANAIYLTMSSTERQHPYIVRSNDAGATWTELDLSPQLGRKPFVIRILAVDPLDANTLYIRLSDGLHDALAITRDAGTTLQIALQLAARMTAFLLRSDGALIVAADDGTSFLSSDAGATFSPWSDAFHMQALAERDGKLYATANSRKDGFVVAVSSDAGEHWQPLLRLDQLRGPMACGSLQTQCADSWRQLQPTLAVLSGAAAGSAAPAAESAEPRDVAGGGCSVTASAQRRRPSVGHVCLTVCAALGGTAFRLRRLRPKPA
jgi:photosystem II stability/assembly factor-like uncharacterized protein